MEKFNNNNNMPPFTPTQLAIQRGFKTRENNKKNPKKKGQEGAI
jgi:hypothetical protein